METPVTLLIAGVEFGWGSAGKLAAVVGALHRRHGGNIRVVGMNSGLGRPVLSGHPIHAWIDVPPHDSAALARVVKEFGASAAVVVLDPGLAQRLEAVGCPVVYLDSLPFLWTDNDPVPALVSRYCAQLCPSLPRSSWPSLRGIRSLHWVGGIVGHDPAPGPRAGAGAPRTPGKAVVNFGGLHSPFRERGGDDAYLSLVVQPLLHALRAAGFHEVVVAGNIDVTTLPADPGGAGGMRVGGGRLPRAGFLRELRTAELVLTSPGRTTLLELAAFGQRAVVLPAQNMSQIVNADDVAAVVGPHAVVPWPAEVLDPAEVGRCRPLGEEHVVALIYRSIAAAAARPGAVRAVLGRLFDAAIDAVQRAGTTMAPFAETTGTGGAEQVAGIVEDLLRDRRTAPAR